MLDTEGGRKVHDTSQVNSSNTIAKSEERLSFKNDSYNGCYSMEIIIDQSAQSFIS